MKILVTGSNGQLGNEMRRVATESCAEHEFIFTDVAELDITDAAAVLEAAKGVGAIVNCAAYTNVDAAEDNEEVAHLINATAAANLAAAAKAEGALLIHVSTDYVFGGDGNTPRTEDMPTSPLGAYGRTKLAGELAITASGCRSVIIRTAWLYSIHGKNFVKTMLSLMATRPALNVVFDQVGTPTYALDLAQAIVVIIADYQREVSSSLAAQGSPLTANSQQPIVYSKYGIYHYSNEGVCSWYDFAKMIQQIATELTAHSSPLTAHCDVQPCHSDEFPSPVTRPSYSVLDKTKIKETFGVSVPYWTDSLKRCINNLKNK